MKKRFYFFLTIVVYLGSIYNYNASATNKLKTIDNFQQSPYTGFTRAHWLEITEQILAGALSYVNPQTGVFDLPKATGAYANYQDFREEGQTRIMERIMVGAIIYTTATGKDEIPGYKGSISAPFLNAIIRGTDPESDGYWGDPRPHDQIGASFALGIYACPEHFWDPLTKKQKQNLLGFFKKQSFNTAYDNNHYYFHMVATSLLEKYGMESNREHHTRMLERLMGWYRGDGWFIDGGNRGFDNYNFWGFQLFNQMIFKYDSNWKKQFGTKIQETSSRLLEMLPFLFGRNGAPIPWGRSLSYRFSNNAAIAWPIINGNSTLSPGMARRITSGNLKYFWENNCLGENGLLNLGYRDLNFSLPENYLIPGDPYFAMHGLSCLLIPEDNAFWIATEEPMPADGAGGKMTVEGAEFTLRVSPIDGEARLYPVGQPFEGTQWQIPIKYHQHAYSSALGFCLTGEGGEDIGAGRTGYSYDGKKWLYRYQPRFLFAEPDHVASIYKLKTMDENPKASDYKRDEIITHTLIGNDGEVHVFWHNYPDSLFLSLGGYGVSSSNESEWKEIKTDGDILIQGGDYYSILRVINAPKGEITSVLLKPREGFQYTHLFGGLGIYSSWHSSAGIPPHVPVIIHVNGTKGRIPGNNAIGVEKLSGRLIISFEGKKYEIKVINP